MGKLEGKIALITGGNGGIGRETAKQFVSEGVPFGMLSLVAQFVYWSRIVSGLNQEHA